MVEEMAFADLSGYERKRKNLQGAVIHAAVPCRKTSYRRNASTYNSAPGHKHSADYERLALHPFNGERDQTNNALKSIT